MKVVINRCYGGFSLSPLAVKRLAELDGRECYFFKMDPPVSGDYVPVTIEEIGGMGRFAMWFAFDIPNPNEVLKEPKNWNEMSMKERQAHNAKYEKHQIENRERKRDDKALVKVVEELGEKANGGCAELKIVKIPNGVQYVIDEYDGMESVHEKHKVWA